MLWGSFSPGSDRACRHCWISSFGTPLGKRLLYFKHLNQIDNSWKKQFKDIFFRLHLKKCLKIIDFLYGFHKRYDFHKNHDLLHFCFSKKAPAAEMLLPRLWLFFTKTMENHHDTFVYNCSAPWQGAFFRVFTKNHRNHQNCI